MERISLLTTDPAAPAKTLHGNDFLHFFLDSASISATGFFILLFATLMVAGWVIADLAASPRVRDEGRDLSRFGRNGLIALGLFIVIVAART